MFTHKYLALIAVCCFIAPSFGADECAAGKSKLKAGEPCIPELLFNYLYCLINSGGGNVEVHTVNSSDAKNNLVVGVKGAGSGVIIKGEAGGDYSKSSVVVATNEIQAKLSPDLAARCQSMAEKILISKAVASTPISPSAYAYPARYRLSPGGSSISTPDFTEELQWTAASVNKVSDNLADVTIWFSYTFAPKSNAATSSFKGVLSHDDFLLKINENNFRPRTSLAIQVLPGIKREFSVEFVGLPLSYFEPRKMINNAYIVALRGGGSLWMNPIK